MLETEIKNLAAEIKMLREALTATPLAKADKPKADKPKADKPKADKPSVTVEDLQALCVTLTRADKTNRPLIVKLLEEHNATRIDQVPESEFEALSDSLKKLGA